MVHLQNTTKQKTYQDIKIIIEGTSPVALVVAEVVPTLQHIYCTDCMNTCNRYAIYTGLSKKMDGIWNRYNLKSTGRIYTFGILKCSEKFKVLDLP